MCAGLFCPAVQLERSGVRFSRRSCRATNTLSNSITSAANLSGSRSSVIWAQSSEIRIRSSLSMTRGFTYYTILVPSRDHGRFCPIAV